MRKILMLAATVLLVACGVLPSGNPTAGTPDNQTLTTLYEQDQSARSGEMKAIDWNVLDPQDRQRREQTIALLRQGQVRTAADFFHAAMIFQHGDTPDDVSLAYSLARVSAAMDPGHHYAPTDHTARWLAAAAWDRTLMDKHRPQWFGTQFSRKDGNSPWELYTVDKSVMTDAERAQWDVPPLADALRRAEAMNR